MAFETTSFQTNPNVESTLWNKHVLSARDKHIVFPGSIVYV